LYKCTILPHFRQWGTGFGGGNLSSKSPVGYARFCVLRVRYVLQIGQSGFRSESQKTPNLNFRSLRTDVGDGLGGSTLDRRTYRRLNQVKKVFINQRRRSTLTKSNAQTKALRGKAFMVCRNEVARHAQSDSGERGKGFDYSSYPHGQSVSLREIALGLFIAFGLGASVGALFVLWVTQ